MTASSILSAQGQSGAEMRTRPYPKCYLCNSLGEVLYENLTDRLFDSVSGTWTLKRCTNPECALIWQDPMPLEEDIGLAYRTYYTHGQSPVRPSRPVRWIVDAYRKNVASIFSGINPMHRVRNRLELMCLCNERPGLLLEVGCGSGARLAKLRDLGWTVFGHDVDPRAVASARHEFRLDVRSGPLGDAGFQAKSFDFVVLNHVIEHVHDPIKLLVECRHLVRKGGGLILVTPNTNSIGHKWFGVDWIGLDPPRHIFIFSQKTLSAIAESVGFSVRRSWTTSVNAHIFSDGSLRLGYDKSPFSLRSRIFRALYRTVFLYCSTAATVFDPSSGEECVLQLES